MNERVMLIGGGGHAKVIMDIVHACGDTVVGLLDDAAMLALCLKFVSHDVEEYKRVMGVK